MQNHDSTFIDEIVRDQTLGAGNFIYKIYEKMPQKDSPLIYLDEPFMDYSGEFIKELSLCYIVKTANQWAAYYHNVLGIKPKEPVVLFLNESIHYFLQYIALTSIGAIPIFMNGDLDIGTVAFLAMHANARYLISSTNRLHSLSFLFKAKNYSIQFVDLNKISPLSEEKRPSLYKHDEDDTVLLTHTSGTTGIPKIVQFTHAAMFFSIKNEIKSQPGQRILSLLPHSHGSSMTVLMSTLSRLTSIKIQAQKEPSQILKEIETYRPDLVVAFPKVLVDLCRHDLKAYDLSSVQYWLSTGDANHESHIRKLIANGFHWKNGIKKEGSVFIDNLGSSEFSFAMFKNVHTLTTNHYDRCIGTPFSWVESAILSEDGSILPPNAVGYLGVKSKSVTKGYWNNTYLTEKNRLSGFWLTGDLAYRNEQNVYYHVDRISDKIETESGVLYSCQAEEWTLKNIPYIFDISFIGSTNKKGTIEIQALVELQKETTDADTTLLKQEINHYLNLRQWPNVASVNLQSAHEYVGVTGKKLKRKMRLETSS